VKLGVNLRRIEEAFEAASLDEFELDTDAELFELSDDELEEISGGGGKVSLSDFSFA
jgi:bacteriocin-like protein